jgi:hypothetical protein
MAEPKFKNLIYFVVDFDSQKDAVNFFGAQMQSTLIAFKGEHETGRSVGDTDRSSIAEDTLIYERWRGRSGVCCGRADKSVALRPAHPPSGRRGVRAQVWASCPQTVLVNASPQWLTDLTTRF